MRLGDTNFFNVFSLVAAATNPNHQCDAWSVEHVRWTRERTTHKGPTYTFQIEIHTLTHDGRNGWTLLLGHEIWWESGGKDAFRNGRWAHLINGARADVVKWFTARENELVH